VSSNSAEEVIRKLYQARRRTPPPRAKVAPCPLQCANPHEDKNPSFGVSDKNGKLLFHCLAGYCTQNEAMKGLREMGIFKEAETVAAPLPPASTAPDMEWGYRDELGFLIAVHGRWNTPIGKEIRWKLPDGTYKEGLQDLSVEKIPLYGADILKKQPTETVVFCEGESAVDICRKNGLLAVTNPGGASQRRFGNSLEVLRDRNVELFPDNDPPGRLLMQTIQASLRPIARSVSILNPGKNLPYKGDAVQFFGDLKGTVDELRTASEPTIEHLDHDRLRLQMPIELAEMRGTIIFLFENIRPQQGKLETDLTITPPASPIASENHQVHRHLNMKSSSGVSAFIREVKTTVNGLDWGPIISRAVSLATVAIYESAEDAPIDLAASNDEEPQTWLIDGVMPNVSNIVIFGAGSSLKSISLQALVMSAVLGRPWGSMHIRQEEHRVLILDYENTKRTWMRYQRRLTNGLGLDAFPEKKLSYLSMNGVPLVDKYESVQKAIRKNDINLVVIDSAALGCGGDPSDSYATLQYFNILQKLNDLGVTTFTIAHVTKNSLSKENKERETRQPFGSAYWSNSARATFYVESRRINERKDFYKVIYTCRKMNVGAEPDDFALDIQFVDPEGPIFLVHGDPVAE
jgi:hypothetical protein